MGAALIAALACPAQLVTEVRPNEVRTAVVACRRGRRVVLARARMVWRGPRRPTGRRITGVDGAGRRIVWSEMRRGGGRARGSVVVSRLERGGVRRVYRRLVLRRPGALDVVLSNRGELSWLARDHVYTAATTRGPARLVARNAYGRDLGLEDDRTLRWFRDTGEILRVAYEDLRPWRGDGCPVRRRFRVVAESPDVVVGTAYYGSFEQWVEVVRVCTRATGEDPVVLQYDAEYPSSDSISRAAAAGPWVVLVLRSTGKGANCVHESIEALNAVDGTRRRSDAGCWSTRTELDGAPMVLTDTGFPAWILRYPDRSAVVTTSGGGLVELDSARRDGLTGLAVEGRVVRWLHDGEPRSAVLE